MSSSANILMVIRRIMRRKELSNNMSRIHVYHDNNSAPKGIGFTGLLQVAFIVLKLCGVIKWSWWCVLLPTIIPIGLAAMIVAVAFIIAVVKDE